MTESYVEYILSKCGDSEVAFVCKRFKTKDALLKAAMRGINGETRILGQWNIISHSFDLVNDSYIDVRSLNHDAEKLHRRIYDNFKAMKNEVRNGYNIDKERLFNALVDLNWLIASYYKYDNEHQKQIPLLENSLQIRNELKIALEDLFYDNALYDIERSQQYESAIKVRYQIFNGLHPDAEVRELYSKGYTGYDFKERKKQALDHGVKNMALYFALTATSARAEQIRRMR